MMTSGPRFAVGFDARPWQEDVVAAYRGRSRARAVAEAARHEFEHHGVPFNALIACDPQARDGTRLAGIVKCYLPFTGRPAAERPFGMLFLPVAR